MSVEVAKADPLARPAGGDFSGPGRRPGVRTVYRWELTKLRYQKRTYLGLGAAFLVPIIFVVAMHFRHDRHGGDFAFASYLNRSGLAVPLVIMLFGAVWMFPLITALVAGDIFASEDHNGTLKTIFTRSLERHQIFAGKALAAATYAVVAILLPRRLAIRSNIVRSGPPPVGIFWAASVSAQRSVGEPCREMWPRRALPLELRMVGARPAQARRCRAVGKRVTSPISAITSIAV